VPTVTVEGSVTLQQAATALQDKLGRGYEVTTHGTGAHEALKVKQSAASTATVHLDQDQNATTFHVHGGGLVISRMVNEFGIAKKVATAITEAFPAPPGS
jgi:16S rRNA C1402 N4-methylase RsmH